MAMCLVKIIWSYRNKFIQFLRGHTLITQDVEIRRIFPKILNIYSYANMSKALKKVDYQNIRIYAPI